MDYGSLYVELRRAESDRCNIIFCDVLKRFCLVANLWSELDLKEYFTAGKLNISLKWVTYVVEM